MSETMKGYAAEELPQDVIRRYLQDAIAVEQNFVTVNRAIAKEATLPHVRQLFEQHADETKVQEERLTARLEALGGHPSGMKGFFAHVFGTSPKAAQMGRDDSEKTTQDLMMAFASENSEVAMYESLAIAAKDAGDPITEQLARDIQQEERRMAEQVWSWIGPSAHHTFLKVTGRAMEHELQS
jgi:ferritin-like metal-binding protein YciE